MICSAGKRYVFDDQHQPDEQFLSTTTGFLTSTCLTCREKRNALRSGQPQPKQSRTMKEIKLGSEPKYGENENRHSAWLKILAGEVERT